MLVQILDLMMGDSTNASIQSDCELPLKKSMPKYGTWGLHASIWSILSAASVSHNPVLSRVINYKRLFAVKVTKIMQIIWYV